MMESTWSASWRSSKSLLIFTVTLGLFVGMFLPFLVVERGTWKTQIFCEETIDDAVMVRRREKARDVDDLTIAGRLFRRYLVVHSGSAKWRSELKSTGRPDIHCFRKRRALSTRTSLEYADQVKMRFTISETNESRPFGMRLADDFWNNTSITLAPKAMAFVR